MKPIHSYRRLTEILICLCFVVLIFFMKNFETSAKARIGRVEREIEEMKDGVLASLADDSFPLRAAEIERRIATVLSGPDFAAMVKAYEQGIGDGIPGFRQVTASASFGPSGVANQLYALDTFVASVAEEQETASDTLSTLLLILSVIFLGMFVWTDIAAGRRLARLKRRKELEAGLVAAIERERDLIALDLHDSVLQKLGFVGQQLEDRHGGCERVAGIRNLVSESIRELRDLYAGLRREDRLESEPEARLAEIFDEFRGLAPITLETSLFGLDPNLLPPSAWHHVVRIAQELLSNGYKHAKAGRITLRVYTLPGSLRILYSDDGIGYQGAVPPRLGSVEYRCAILGADHAFSRAANSAGFSAKIEVPLS